MVFSLLCDTLAAACGQGIPNLFVKESNNMNYITRETHEMNNLGKRNFSVFFLLYKIHNTLPNEKNRTHLDDGLLLCHSKS